MGRVRELFAPSVGYLHPHDVTYLGLVAAASLIGFSGNELVARDRIRIGRQIGSAALVADGLHARTDGLTSGGTVPESHRVPAHRRPTPHTLSAHGMPRQAGPDPPSA